MYVAKVDKSGTAGHEFLPTRCDNEMKQKLDTRNVDWIVEILKLSDFSGKRRVNIGSLRLCVFREIPGEINRTIPGTDFYPALLEFQFTETYSSYGNTR